MEQTWRSFLSSPTDAYPKVGKIPNTSLLSTVNETHWGLLGFLLRDFLQQRWIHQVLSRLYKLGRGKWTKVTLSGPQKRIERVKSTTHPSGIRASKGSDLDEPTLFPSIFTNRISLGMFGDAPSS
jgi:hypothetical protein